MKLKILILAPHTDDGELGCGATIAKYCDQGHHVYYVAFSNCNRSLPVGMPLNTLIDELYKATLVLGIPKENVTILDYDVRTFKEFRQPILEDLIRIKNEINPDIVYLPSPNDLHQDHQVISKEGLRAFKNITIFGYEMPWNNISFQTIGFNKLDKKYIDIKINALKEYKSQMHRNYLNDNFIESLAKVRGVQIGTSYAEAFEVIRLVNN
jgi:N-acetylglucosamine malate deacetylase 1